MKLFNDIFRTGIFGLKEICVAFIKQILAILGIAIGLAIIILLL